MKQKKNTKEIQSVPRMFAIRNIYIIIMVFFWVLLVLFILIK